MIVGVIMIARITPPENRSLPMAGPWKSPPTTGTGPSAAFNAGSTVERMIGERTKNPHRP
jgi:hypothetical protein